MSTFSAYGMGPGGFQVNRPLNEYEREHRFDTKHPVSDRVHYELSLIKLNSIFVECVDKWYSMRGFVAMAGAAFAGVICFGLYAFTTSAIRRGGPDVVLTLLGLGFLTMLWFAVKFLRSDAFTYTHYPIRMNRRNRQVYAFRRDGSVLKASWDEMVWTMYATSSRAMDVFAIGHVMQANGVNIKESIGLSLVSVGKEGEQKVRNHFEFFRRYMEHGPGPVLEALKPTPLIMLPGIDKERESWRFSWERITLHENGSLIGMVLYQVIALPLSLFRWLVMRTSKIPQWPQWVEDECAIDPNDLWVRDGRHRAGAVRG
jgi:hypothetical protein